MREILFRGKREDNGEWVEGYVAKHIFAGYTEYLSIDVKQIAARYTQGTEYIYQPYKVNPETVGQFTGSYDKNHRRLFEGDIVKIRQDRNDGVGVIGYEHGSFIVYVMSGEIYERTLFEYWYNDWDLEYVGNKHDDPDF